MPTKNRTALTYYVENRPEIIKPIISDPSDTMKDVDAYVGTGMGALTSTLLALKMKRLPLLTNLRLGTLAAKAFSRSGIGSSFINKV